MKYFEFYIKVPKTYIFYASSSIFIIFMPTVNPTGGVYGHGGDLVDATLINDFHNDCLYNIISRFREHFCNDSKKVYYEIENEEITRISKSVLN